jgi:hypothetical protein
MKKFRKDNAERSCLRELDQLVWQEFNALTPKTQSQPPRRKDSWEIHRPATDLRTEIIELNEKRLYPQSEFKQEHLAESLESDDHAFATVLCEAADQSNLADEISPAGKTCFNGFNPEFSPSQDELLSKEEEEFVDQTVRWLSGRENKDVIVARIWTLLTELEPESFYSPASEQNQDLEGPSEPVDGSQGTNCPPVAGSVTDLAPEV